MYLLKHNILLLYAEQQTQEKLCVTEFSGKHNPATCSKVVNYDKVPREPPGNLQLRQPENLLTNLHLNHLRLFLLMPLVYSDLKKNISEKNQC
jgi:hypothetical protein